MLGGEVKFLSGMGIFFTMYSQITSMLYFSWADIGTTGAPSAIVPCSNKQKRIRSTRKEEIRTITREMVNSIDLDEFLDCFMLIHRCTFLDKINFVLQNDDMLKTHDFNSSKMLRCLGLRTTFIRCDQKQRSIHDSSSIKHCSHKNVVSLFKVGIVETYNHFLYHLRST